MPMSAPQATACNKYGKGASEVSQAAVESDALVGRQVETDSIVPTRSTSASTGTRGNSLAAVHSGNLPGPPKSPVAEEAEEAGETAGMRSLQRNCFAQIHQPTALGLPLSIVKPSLMANTHPSSGFPTPLELPLLLRHSRIHLPPTATSFARCPGGSKKKGEGREDKRRKKRDRRAIERDRERQRDRER